MAHNDSAQERAPLFALAAFLTGSALGLLEATWLAFNRVPTSAASAQQALLLAALGYGLLALLAGALVYALGPRFGLRRRLTLAVGAGAGSTAAVLALSIFKGMGLKQYALLVPGALLLGLVIARLADALLQRLPYEASMARVCAGHLAALAVSAALVYRAFGRGPQPTLALIVAVAGGAVAAVLLAKPTWTAIGLAANVTAAVLVAGLVPFSGTAATSGNNVILISVDTLRADRLGAYGYSTAHTPHLDALAAAGFVFENAHTSSARTGPSHTTMLTGLHPHRHGAVSNGRRPSGGLRSLPRELARNGYTTGAVVSGWPLRADVSGLADYFDDYDNNFSDHALLPETLTEVRLFNLIETLSGHQARVESAADATTRRALDWLGRNAQRPFFLWIHYYDPHVPYDPPRQYERLHARQGLGDFDRNWFRWQSEDRERLLGSPAEMQYMKQLYDGEISFTDAAIGELLDGLEAMGVAERTITLVTADHGETLDEHDLYFGHNDLYETSLRVPLILKVPGEPSAPQRIAEPVLTVDITPTLLDLLGLDIPEGLDGLSFAGYLGSSPPLVREPALSSLLDADLELYSVTRDTMKLIWTAPRWVDETQRQPGQQELYDLDSDPEELNDLADQHPELIEELKPFIDLQRVSHSPQSLSEEDREKLRSLGYLN